jgi:HemY protein
MKYLLWILGLFAAAAALSTAALHNQAYVMLVYPPYRVELSFLLFVVFFLAAFAFGYGLLRLAISVLRLPAYVRQFQRERTQARARELLEEVLGSFFEGRYAAAEKLANHAMELGETSILYPIIAARSAHELHDYKKRDAYLSASESMAKGGATMRLMATGKFMLDQRNPRAALSALQELRDSGVRGHVGAMSLELKAQQQAGNWDEVLGLLDQLEKRSSIEATVAAQLRQLAWLEKIRQQQDLAGLNTCLKRMPADLKRRSQFVAVAAQELIRHSGGTLAQQLLADSLNAQWDSELVKLYGDCISGDVVAQIQQAEKWLNLHKLDTGLLLSLGKLCLHQKLWGKAQNYLEASISVEPSQAAYNALALLSERLGKPDQAFRYYHMAMSLAR